MQQLLEQYSETKLKDITHVFLLCGTNNLIKLKDKPTDTKYKKCTDEILNGYYTIIKELEKLSNIQHIYILEIANRIDVQSDLICNVNKQLLSLQNENNKLNVLPWCKELSLDIRSTHYYNDGVHLLTDGYEIMCKHIIDYF